MSFLLAAAGTGGHVFPGLAVGEALVDLGVPRSEVLYVGGDRLEARVYPTEGFPFLQVELRGMARSLTLRNLAVPRLVLRATGRIRGAMATRGVRVAMGMGGYVTVPTALAARKEGAVFMHAEQNVKAGLGNRIAARWATRSFGAFPETRGLEAAEWVGNPVRRQFWSFNREALRPQATARYRLRPAVPVLGVFGGSLGAAALNEAVASMAAAWRGPEVQIVHLAGEQHRNGLLRRDCAGGVYWLRIGFEDSMEMFYAACDLVLARAGGAVAELTATTTPAILVPGEFGSTGHQRENAAYLARAGAALTLEQAGLDRLSDVVEEVLFDEDHLERMRVSAQSLARPLAAQTIASAMLEAAG